ncbi:MAG: response regulator [bacterium]
MSEEIKASILLVDDEEKFIEVLSQRLEGRGLKVDISTSGENALKRVKDKDFDAIVLDLAMPGLDGIETIRRMRKMNPDLQIIMLTGHATVEKGVAAIKEGAADLLEKPVDLNKLLSKIEEAKHKKVLIIEKEHEEKIKEILKTKSW